MSAGLAVFDTTLQETDAFLNLVEARLHPCDHQQAYAATRAVLQELRDRLPVDIALGLSAQLPMLMRGFFLEGWRPEQTPSDIRDFQTFAQAVAARLPPRASSCQTASACGCVPRDERGLERFASRRLPSNIEGGAGA